jgi:hypothetical protein
LLGSHSNSSLRKSVQEHGRSRYHPLPARGIVLPKTNTSKKGNEWVQCVVNNAEMTFPTSIPRMFYIFLFSIKGLLPYAQLLEDAVAFM